MPSAEPFLARLEAKVLQQLSSQRIGYLLGAGSSYLASAGYPLASDLWSLIQDMLDSGTRAAIEQQLAGGALGIEHALDLLDHGGADDTPYRHAVTHAIADLFRAKTVDLSLHASFLKRINATAQPSVRIFSLNYDPLVERAADAARLRLVDGFVGLERLYFEPAVFDERIGHVRGNYRTRLFEPTVRPLHLFKLHGSLGWYETADGMVERCNFGDSPPTGARRLMIPPQRRKAADTMLPPYAALWSAFRGSLGQDARPLNRLACIGYGFADEHVNAVIEPALARSDFTLLMMTKTLSDPAWARWSSHHRVIVVTSNRCSMYGEIGPGHADLWSFERIAREG